MKILNKIVITIIISLFCQYIFSQSRNGLIGEPPAQSIIISVGANYFFGDIEKSSLFSKYWIDQVNGLGQIGYVRNVLEEKLRLRINLLGGLLNGKRDNYHFKNLILEPDVLLEYFPFIITKNKNCGCAKENLGLYIYGGIGLSLYSGSLYNSIKNFKYKSYSPMAALGLGYRFEVVPKVELGIELSFRIAMLNKLNLSLDGYPFKDDNGHIVNKNYSQWSNGFYIVGIMAGYKF